MRITISFDDPIAYKNEGIESDNVKSTLSNENNNKISRDDGGRYLGKKAPLRKFNYQQGKLFMLKAINTRSLKFLNIRPNDEYIASKFGIIQNGYVDYAKLKREWLSSICELISFPFFGSVEFNDKKTLKGFIHMHLAIECTTKELESIFNASRDVFTCLHHFGRKQFAVKKVRLDYKNIDVHTDYYLGKRDGTFKKEFNDFVTNITLEDKSFDDLASKNTLLLTLLNLKFN